MLNFAVVSEGTGLGPELADATPGGCAGGAGPLFGCLSHGTCPSA